MDFNINEQKVNQVDQSAHPVMPQDQEEPQQETVVSLQFICSNQTSLDLDLTVHLAALSTANNLI